MKILFLMFTCLWQKNLNSFSLDRKLADSNKHEMIYMFWKECMPSKSTSIFGRKNISCTWTVKMSYIQRFWKSSLISCKRMRTTTRNWRIIYLVTRTFSSTCILTFFLRSIAPLKNVVSIWKVIFTASSSSVLWVKIQRIMNPYVTKLTSTNRNL